MPLDFSGPSGGGGSDLPGQQSLEFTGSIETRRGVPYAIFVESRPGMTPIDPQPFNIAGSLQIGGAICQI